MAVITVILILVILVLRKRIALAVQIVKEAAKAVRDSPSIVFLPFIVFALLFVFILYWMGIASYLATASDPTYKGDKFVGFEPNQTLRYAQIYHFFGFLWTTQYVSICRPSHTSRFLIAILQCSLAGVVARWYFTRDKVLSL